MKGVCLIFWMILSFLLVCTVIGLVLFIPKDTSEYRDNTPSTWATIGRKLLDSITNN